MKRYVKASFDSSIPEWLKDKFTRSRYPNFAQRFVDKYGVALSDVEFLDSPSGRSITIYKIGNRVYIPGINDDEEIPVNGRWRKFKSIAKAKLPDLADDMVYVDLDSNKIEKGEKYQDPRYSYRNNPKGRYAGQYYDEDDDEWRTFTPSNEIRSRDKSGYQVPSPASQLRRYYQKFPEKITAKVDDIYNRILEVKDKVLAPDLINTPHDRNEEMSIGNAIYRLKDAIEGYRDLLSRLKDFDELVKGDYSDYYIGEFSDAIRKISNSLDEAERNLTSRW